MQALITSPLIVYCLKTAVLFAIYFFTARLGLSLSPVNMFAAPLWAPSGIAFAALYLYGYRLWPAIFLAATAVNFIQGAPFLAALGIGMGNTLEAVFGVGLLRRVFLFDRFLSRARDAIAIIVAALIASSVSATIGNGSLFLSHLLSAEQFSATWSAWWIGDVLGIIVLAPFFIRWLPDVFFKRTPLQYLEALGALLFLTGTAYLVFWSPLTHFGIFPLFYLLFAPLMWLTLRTGPRIMTLAIFLTVAIAVTGIFYGNNPALVGTESRELLSLQLVLAVMGGLFLVFTSLEEERKEVRQELDVHVHKLEEALQKIRSSDYAKTQFLAILAHELRNPLAPIVSALELIKTKSRGTIGLGEGVRMMEKNVHNMTRLLDDLLDISRISRRKFTLERERVDLRKILARGVQSAEPYIKAREHTLSVFTPSYPVSVTADSVRLEQIIVNLLHNAAKYTPPRGRIFLSCLIEAGARCALIKVADNGVGINPKMRERIFEPFVQVSFGADVEPGKGGGGLGIGLSLVKRLIELHGGAISVKSDGEGKGSEFTVELPLTPSEGTAVTTFPSEAPVLSPLARSTLPTSSGYRILVVDDNEDAARGLGTLLAQKGREVRIAHSGSAVLRLIEDFTPTAAVLDIGLPDMNGYAFAKKLREKIKGPLFLIALSGYGQVEDKEEALAAGFDIHLTKPIKSADIEAILSRDILATAEYQKARHSL